MYIYSSGHKLRKGKTTNIMFLLKNLHIRLKNFAKLYLEHKIYLLHIKFKNLSFLH